MTTPEERAGRVETGLLPIMRIAGHDTRWTMAERMAHYHVPGVAVTAMEDGRIDFARGFGSGSAQRAQPIDGDTIFMGASCSKPVTAFLTLQCVERGWLDLDVDVNTYLKRWKVPQNEFTQAEAVTLRRALSHTAGLTVNGWPVVPQGQEVPSVLDLMNGTEKSRHGPVVVNKAHDGVDRYSGGGFVIAEMAIEDVTGRKFADLADELIFKPLAMTRTTFHQPLPEHLRSNVAGGHRPDGSAIPGGWMISAEMGAGGILMSSNDYARFMFANRAAWRGEKGAVLGRTLAAEMMTPQFRSGFGLGWRILGNGASRRFNHGGSNDGYQSEANCYLDSGDGGVVLTNGVGGSILFYEVMNALADLYAWPDYMAPPKRLRTMSAAEQDRYIGQYRIVSGIELPLVKIWRDGGRLMLDVPGLRAGVQQVYIDEDGVMFNQAGPFETRVRFGADGKAAEFVTYEGGTTEIMRAVRA